MELGVTESFVAYEMSAAEFIGWQRYHNRVPFAAERQDLLLANLIALTANINRKPDTRPISAFDVLPWVRFPIGRNDQTANKNLVAEKNTFKAKLKKR